METLIEYYKALKAALEPLGLSLNESKCEISILDSESKSTILERFKELSPHFKLVAPKNLRFLGAAILQTETSNVLNEKLADLNRMSERLLTLDSHDALYLPRNCLYIPRLNYFLRVSEASRANLLRDLDETIRRTLLTLLNIDLTEDWTLVPSTSIC